MTYSNRLKRILLFIFGCIAVRLSLVWAAANVRDEWLLYMGIAALAVAVGFIIIHQYGLRQTGPEVFGESIWWDNMRPIHALMYATFFILAVTGRRSPAWKVLLLDAILGFVAFAKFHLHNAE